jgi:hypothetical protein
MHLPRGNTAILEAPLNAAIGQLTRNNKVAACSQLNAFLVQVNKKQTNGQLTSQQATDLRQQGTAIQHAIGCSSSPLSSLGSGISVNLGAASIIIGNPNEIIQQQQSSSSLLQSQQQSPSTHLTTNDKSNSQPSTLSLLPRYILNSDLSII